MTLWAICFGSTVFISKAVTHILCHWEHETLRTTKVDLQGRAFWTFTDMAGCNGARIRDGKYQAGLGVVGQGSMTSDSSYVIMVPGKGDLLTCRPTGIDDFRCGIAYQGHHSIPFGQ
jgi:hypothetical protein